MKKQPLLIRVMAGVAVALIAFVSLPLRAIDIQPIADTARAGISFTHRARITSSDITNSVIYSTLRIFPGSGNGLSGDAIDRIGVFIHTPFYVTNANAGSNAVFLNVGRSDVTNSLISNMPIGSNQTQLAYVSNSLTPYILSGATNYLTASITFSNAAMAAALHNGNGEVYIYMRVVRFDRISTP